MLDSLLYTVNGVCPVILLIVIGYFLRRIGIVSADMAKGLNKLTFKLLLPCSLFKSIYNIAEGTAFRTNFVVFGVTGIFIELALAILLVRPVVKERKRIGSCIQGIYRGNFVLLGLPLAGNLFGDEGTLLASMLMPFTIALFNIMAVIVLSIYGSDDGKAKVNIGSLLLGIIKNPLIIATLLAVLFRFTPLTLPEFSVKTVNYIAGAATPMALIALGAQFDIHGFRKNLPVVAYVSSLRLVILPALYCVAAYLLGFRGAEIGCLFILFGTPVAVSSHIMAINQGCDGDLAGDILVATSILCMLTLFIGVLILRLTGLV